MTPQDPYCNFSSLKCRLAGLCLRRLLDHHGLCRRNPPRLNRLAWCPRPAMT